MISYCKKCVMPETKPDLGFDKSGVCNACTNFDNRSEVDWIERRVQLESLLDNYKLKSNGNYDCIVPVSGGKDSIYSVVRCMQLGKNRSSDHRLRSSHSNLWLHE